MIPDSMLAANPAISKKLVELVNKKMCRFCLSETEDLFDIVEDKSELTDTNWKLILTTCFSISSVISKNLPKYACERCCEFVKKCYEFHQLRRKAEVMLLSYTVTGFWTQSLDVPEWLRPAKKRQLGEEMVVDSLTDKRFCFDEEKDCQVTEGPLSNTKEMSSESEASLVGTIRIRSHEYLTVQPTLQSPTITSENAHLTAMSQNVYLQQSGANTEPINQQSQQLPNFDPHIVRISEMEPSTRPDYLFQPLMPNVLVQQLPKPSTSHPILRQKLNPLPPQYATSLNQPSTSNSSSAWTQTAQQNQSTTLERPPPYKSPLPHLRCLTCSIQFVNQSHLDLHMRRHASKVEFRCGCGEQIRDWDRFVAHIEQRHLLLGWCYLCGQEQPVDADSDWRVFQAHLRRHLGAKLDHACDFCLLIFASGPERMEHIRRKHWEEAVQVGL